MKFKIDWNKLTERQTAFLGGCIALGLVIAAAVVSGGILDAKRAGDVISVTGAADKFISADHIVWSCSVATRGGSMDSAYKQLKGVSEKVKAYLLEKGVKPEELSLSQVSTSTLYERDDNGNSTNSVEGYDMTQTFTVDSDRVDDIEQLANQSNDLISQGITFTANSPQYYYSKLNDLKVEMLGKASMNAKERAQSMARSTGNSIGVIRSAQMGVFQITDKNSTDVSDYGINDTSSKQKKVTAVVNVTFSVR